MKKIRSVLTRLLTFAVVVLCGMSCAQDLGPQSPNLSGIAHVAFRVNDLQKSRDFYKTLGFEQAFAFSDAGNTSTAFIKINDHQFIELYPRTSDSQPGGLLHICFEAADLQSVRNAYLTQGLQPTEIKKARAGNLLFVMHDPEGQLLEYTQYLPDSLHSQTQGKFLENRRISTHLFAATAGVKDLEAERAFYIAKLAFRESGPRSPNLYPAGDSDNEVQLQSASDKPRIVFSTADLKETARNLRSRGFQLQKGHGAVSITDPDGTIIGFTSPRSVSGDR
jgi:catechol 2,3-dioxygenase-like lactoylglutathione lyase family enzyme